MRDRRAMKGFAVVLNGGIHVVKVYRSCIPRAKGEIENTPRTPLTKRNINSFFSYNVKAKRSHWGFPVMKPARKQKVLFVCTHNSGRSLMAQALLNQLYGDKFEGAVRRFAPWPDRSVGRASDGRIRDRCFPSRGEAARHHQNRPDIRRVVTICDEDLDRHPIFPGVTERLEWSFPDPLATKEANRPNAPPPASSATKSKRKSKNSSARASEAA
jgi:arsenate reductase